MENLAGYSRLLSVLCSRLGNLLNLSELNNTVLINMETCKKYISFLEGTYILHFLKPFYRNIGKKISKTIKIFLYEHSILKYFLDLLNSIVCDKIPGSYIENFTFRELSLRNMNQHYYRTISKSEIDFIVNKENDFYLIESKFSNNPKPPLVFKNFVEKYSKGIKIVINKDYLNPGDINYIPAYLFAFCDFLFIEK